MELDLNVAEVAPEKTAAMATSDSGSSESWVLNAEVFGGWAALAEGSSSTPPSSAVLEFSILGSESDAVGAAAATPRHRHRTTTTSRNSSRESSFRPPQLAAPAAAALGRPWLLPRRAVALAAGHQDPAAPTRRAEKKRKEVTREAKGEAGAGRSFDMLHPAWTADVGCHEAKCDKFVDTGNLGVVYL